MTRHMLFAAILFSAPSLGAQNGSLPVQSARLESAVARLDGNTTLRVRTTTTTAEGRFGGTSADGLLLVKKGGIEAPIPLENVTAIWKLGNSAGKGAAVGTVIGGTLLGGLGVLFVAGLCESTDGCTSDKVRLAFLGGAVGAGAGAVLGTIFGSLSRQWVRILP
jgi:hypothetical protein